ncbi:putative cytochrome P450 [Zopfia rhizophila CBS 207.26]|uniref:Putative cytochrome P450 n=1 Tax=Zopfia rhizophila CBS 207.26 TaxID=1314779 RepID=A0A6A6ED68_9PEZI|nr:putative cytochrome P450 [Zopfia rhizophila CBS 207.26]
MALSNLIVTAGAAVATALGYLVLAVYRHRSRINQLRKRGVPMPEGWSWFTGHSLVLLKYTSRFPPLANVALAMQEICRDFAESEMLVLEMWPAYDPVILSFNPEAGIQMSQKFNLPKPEVSRKSVEPIVGGLSVLSMNDNEWKYWRSLLNPGFSTNSLTDHVPYIVDCVEVFCDKLRAQTGNSVFSLNDFATRLTFDVIMKVALDVDIDYQRSEHILPTAINTITKWHSFWDPRVLLNPIRLVINRYYGAAIKNYIRKEMEQRFTELKQERLSSPPNISKRPKSVFAAKVSHQIHTFLFAGNDTTSSTIVFMYHILFRHPEVLSQLRSEHDEVFGPDASKAAATLKAQPALINQCRYTLAVIKETLRVYPPATSMRQGLPGVSLTTLNGISVPTEGFGIVINHQAVHQNPRVWPRVDEFLPERWLVPPEHELYPHPGAFRPFDMGPRTCIGQPLTLNEMRIVSIMTVRTFILRPAYEEWDRIQAQNVSLWSKMSSLFGKEEINTAGTHPSDGYPCRVSLVE